jgi:hypothetical protein
MRQCPNFSKFIFFTGFSELADKEEENIFVRDSGIKEGLSKV